MFCIWRLRLGAYIIAAAGMWVHTSLLQQNVCTVYLLQGFTGIDDPYEEPTNAEVALEAYDTQGERESVNQAARAPYLLQVPTRMRQFFVGWLWERSLSMLGTLTSRCRCSVCCTQEPLDECILKHLCHDQACMDVFFFLHAPQADKESHRILQLS